MPLITPAELIVLLDLPADTQPTDRAQLVCDLVIDEVTRVAGSVLAEPYPAGLKGIGLAAAARLYDNPTALRSYTTGRDSSTYAGDVAPILTAAEEAKIRAATGAGGPQGSFPAWDWSWTSVPASTLSD